MSTGVEWVKTHLITSFSTYHRKVSLPYRSTRALAQRTRSLHAVAATLAAVQRDVIVCPGDAASETRSHLHAQVLNGHDGVHGDLQRTAHQVGQWRGDTIASEEEEEEEAGNKLVNLGACYNKSRVSLAGGDTFPN